VSNIITPAIPQELIDFLHFYPMFLIAGHKEPDGDCIGSSIAMSLFLQRLGKNPLPSLRKAKTPRTSDPDLLYQTKIPACREVIVRLSCHEAVPLRDARFIYWGLAIKNLTKVDKALKTIRLGEGEVRLCLWARIRQKRM